MVSTSLRTPPLEQVSISVKVLKESLRRIWGPWVGRRLSVEGLQIEAYPLVSPHDVYAYMSMYENTITSISIYTHT